MEINLELYRIFCEVAKCGNITKAAENLFVSQSAVSQAIKQIENKIGLSLFSRSARGVQLTHEGKVLFSYADNAISLIENAQKKLVNMKNLNAGEIYIGASDTVCTLYLLPLLQKFNTEYPDIHISVINCTTKKSISLLKSGAVDLSFINLPIEEDQTLEIMPVMPIHDCFVAGAKYKFLSDSVLSLQDMQKYPLIMLEKASNSRRQMDIFLKERSLEIEPALEFTNLALLAEFAKIGLGIAVTLKEAVQDDINRRNLFELHFDQELPERQIALVQMKNVSLSAAASAFKDAILSSFISK